MSKAESKNVVAGHNVEEEEQHPKLDNQEKTVERSEIELIYGAKHVVHLFVPVSLNMLLTIFLWSLMSDPKKTETAQFLLHEGGGTTGNHFGDAAINSLILIGALVVLTVVMLLLFVFHCYKLIQGWLYFATALIMFGVSLYTLSELVVANNLIMDRITSCLIVWNYGLVGMVAIFGKAPLRWQQFYLICNCAMTSIFYIRMLPKLTAWVFLGSMAAWDAFAVLAPCGPLRIMVEKAQDRHEKLGAGLVYTGGIVTMAEESSSITGAEGNESNSEILTEEQSIRLGLGDFVFYSLLVGEASSTGDVNATIACFLAVLVGLCITLIILSITRKALPALPMSILIGVVFFVSSRYVISPFCHLFASHQIIL